MDASPLVAPVARPVRVSADFKSPQAPISPPRSLPPETHTMDLLRLITCGSVDDGKSTLIGRLLHDTKSIHQDQWEAVHHSSLKRGDARVDLALLTDGLRAEREQGITIDVAYRYFSTPKRKFILVDTPGHVQYTRNMATGASTASLALILIDARQGVVEQTRRHAYIAALLGIAHLVVCVNKMDLVEWKRETFDTIVKDFQAFTASDGAASDEESGVFAKTETTFIPLSALNGDNVVHRSERTPWYEGKTLLEHLETVPPRALYPFPHMRFPVQWVIRPQDDAHHDYRGYAGTIAAGTLKVGDAVVALPSVKRSKVSRIHLGEQELSECKPPMAVSVLLEDDIDLSRGDVLVHAAAVDTHDAAPRTDRQFDADLVWMSEQPLGGGGAAPKRVLIKHGPRTVKAMLGPVRHVLDIHTLAPKGDATGAASGLGLNDIGRVGVTLASPLVFDAYRDCRATGAFIVIDEGTNNTLAAGMIR